MTLQRHPLSAAFPDMSLNDFEALCRDIDDHGIHNPIVLLDGMILDGWHRYCAAQQCDESFVVVDFDGDDPQSWVISQNAHRRHITASQLAIAVATVAQWRPAGRPENNSAPGAELNLHMAPKTASELAAVAGVGSRTVEAAKASIRAGLGEDVRAGRISAKQGEAIAKLPEADRAAALADPSMVKRPSKPAIDEYDPRDDQLRDLVRENEQLRDGILLDHMGETVDARAEYAALLDGLRSQVNALTHEMESLRQSRDHYMTKAAELQKQVNSLQRRIDRAKKDGSGTTATA